MTPRNSSKPAVIYLVARANVAAERHAVAVVGRKHSKEIARRLASIALARDRQSPSPKPGGTETILKPWSREPLPDELLHALARLRTARKELERARHVLRNEDHEATLSQRAGVVVSDL